MLLEGLPEWRRSVERPGHTPSNSRGLFTTVPHGLQIQDLCRTDYQALLHERATEARLGTLLIWTKREQPAAAHTAATEGKYAGDCRRSRSAGAVLTPSYGRAKQGTSTRLVLEKREKGPPDLLTASGCDSKCSSRSGSMYSNLSAWARFSCILNPTGPAAGSNCRSRHFESSVLRPRYHPDHERSCRLLEGYRPISITCHSRQRSEGPTCVEIIHVDDADRQVRETCPGRKIRRTRGAMKPTSNTSAALRFSTRDAAC